MVAQLLQGKLSNILSVEASLEGSTVLRVVATCEDVGGVFVNFEGRDQLAIDLAHLHESLKHVVQLL